MPEPRALIVQGPIDRDRAARYTTAAEFSCSEASVMWTLKHGIGRFVCSTLLICVVAFPVRNADGDDAGLAAKDQSEAKSNLPESGELAKSVGRRLFRMVDCVERHHIAAPRRDELWKCLESELRLSPKSAEADELSQAFARSESPDGFAEALFKRARANFNLYLSKESSAENFAASLNRQFGPIRLIKANRYAVEEQFRANRYVGLGVNLGMVQLVHRSDVAAQYPTFQRVIPGGPAERAGIQPEAVILEVDGKSTRNVETNTLLDWLRGPAGSEVTLRIGANGNQPEHNVTLARGVIRIDSVSGTDGAPLNRTSFRYIPAEPIGGLRVSSITSSTLQELRDAEVRLRADGIRVLVLDFQGGEQSDDFHQARLLADGLLDGGTLWNWHERDAEPRAETADRECLFRGMPLVVLVGQHTGNAHAAVAAALQDAGRAVVVGYSPPFDGAVATGVQVPGEEFVLWMNTARLTRTRADRGWPLIPDHPVRSIVEMMKSGEIRLVPMADKGLLHRIPGLQKSVRRNGAVVDADAAVSALMPQNLTEKQIMLRMPPPAAAAQFQQQQLQIQMQLAARLFPESPQPEALRVARTILKTLPP
jgi:C-terminal processing protease CtpA/Prc